MQINGKNTWIFSFNNTSITFIETKRNSYLFTMKYMLFFLKYKDTIYFKIELHIKHLYIDYTTNFT